MQKTVFRFLITLLGCLAFAINAHAESSIWSTLRKGFRLNHHLNNAKVQHYIRYYQKRPRLVRAIINNGKYYLYTVVHAVKDAKLPMEMALLPFIESGFRPFIVSSADAQGIWQIRPPTGARFRINIHDPWFNGLRDIKYSTTAAIRYLKNLNRQFKGSWGLSISAYNAGEGNVKRARRKAGKNRSVFDLPLPGETKAYYPKLLAISAIVKNPKRYGIKLPNIPDRPLVDTIRLNKQISFELAAQLARIDLEDFINLNPGFEHWATPPKRTVSIYLPPKNARLFMVNYRKFPKAKISPWRLYQVKKGDTLGKIARKTGNTIGVLKYYNQLKNHLIYPKMYLVYPLQHS